MTKDYNRVVRPLVSRSFSPVPSRRSARCFRPENDQIKRSPPNSSYFIKPDGAGFINLRSSDTDTCLPHEGLVQFNVALSRALSGVNLLGLDNFEDQASLNDCLDGNASLEITDGLPSFQCIVNMSLTGRMVHQ